jgi:hypothetical protein
MQLRFNKTYKAWESMKGRCKGTAGGFSKKYYKELDISYDPEWELFASFLADMGECPEGLTLERINNNLGYSADNCRWATRGEQSQNQSRTKLNTKEVIDIRFLLQCGRYRKHLAPQFGVSLQTIDAIAQGRTWKDIE